MTNTVAALTDNEMYERMVSAILDHRLLPGTKLGEDRLATAFGVSRTRIRPVLVRLASEQVVTLTPNRGAAVAQPTVQEAREVFEVRRMIEPTLVELFITHAAQDDIERRVRVLTDRARFLEGRVASEREARALGLVTETSVQASMQALDASRAELATLDLERQQNALRRIQVADDNVERVTEVGRRVGDAERELAALRLTLDQASRVTSTQRGYVREIRSSIGQLVAAGQPLLSLELPDAPLQGVVFVPNDGKRIARGMRVRVAPATVPQQEFGYMMGTVLSVSEQPVTLAGMTKTLGNDLLVEQLAARGPSFLVELSLQRDPATPSGFAWSSRQGPPSTIGSGTGIRVAVEVTRRRPIELLLPFLRYLMGTPV